MRYKPKFCCQCAVPIERADWTLFTSRRFCELCETDYKLDDWLRRAAIAACILFGIVGLGLFLQKPEKPLNLVSKNFAGSSTNINNNAARDTVSSIGNIQTVSRAQNINSSVAIIEKPSPIPVRQDSKAQKVENQPVALEEKVYFCGAPTKKGMPCTRRVKGGGRCWQHTGKPSMLPPEKLVASR